MAFRLGEQQEFRRDPFLLGQCDRLLLGDTVDLESRGIVTADADHERGVICNNKEAGVGQPTRQHADGALGGL